MVIMVKNKKELAFARASLKELKATENRLRSELIEVRDEIDEHNRATADFTAEFKLGARVLYNGKPFQITKHLTSYGNIEYLGRPVRKDWFPRVRDRPSAVHVARCTRSRSRSQPVSFHQPHNIGVNPWEKSSTSKTCAARS